MPAFLIYQIASGNRSCFIFANQDGLFLISCSLAALFQTAKMRMPKLLLAGVVFCFAGRGKWHVAHFPKLVQTSLLSVKVL